MHSPESAHIPPERDQPRKIAILSVSAGAGHVRLHQALGHQAPGQPAELPDCFIVHLLQAPVAGEVLASTH